MTLKTTIDDITKGTYSAASNHWQSLISTPAIAKEEETVSQKFEQIELENQECIKAVENQEKPTPSTFFIEILSCHEFLLVLGIYSLL